MEQINILNKKIKNAKFLKKNVDKTFNDFEFKLRFDDEDETFEGCLKQDKILTAYQCLNKKFNKYIKKYENDLSDVIKLQAREKKEKIDAERLVKHKKRNVRSEPSKYAEYNKNYASIKTKEIKHCNDCKKDISYYCWSKHLKTFKHIKNTIKLNIEK